MYRGEEVYNIKECSILSILIALSMFFFSLRGKLGAIAIVLYIVFLICIYIRSKTIVVYKLSILFAFYIMYFAFVLNFFRTLEFQFYLFVGYFGAVLCLILVRKIECYDALWLMLKIIAILQACAILLQYIVPELYYTCISYVLPDYVVMSIKNRLADGYYTGLTREVLYTMVFICIGLGLFLYKKKKKLGDYLALTLLSFSLIISGKRATLLFFVVAVFMVQFLKSGNKTKQLKYIMIGLLGVFFVVISYPIWSRIGALQRMVQLVGFLKSGSVIGLTNGRTEIYQTAIELWKENKILGIGWGNFKYLVPDDKWYAGFDVHNCYLQILCENGILGFALFLVLIGIVILGIIKLSALVKNKSYQYYSVACFCIYYQLFFLMFSLTEPILYEYPSYILFYICIAITNALLTESKCKNQK